VVGGCIILTMFFSSDIYIHWHPPQHVFIERSGIREKISLDILSLLASSQELHSEVYLVGSLGLIKRKKYQEESTNVSRVSVSLLAQQPGLQKIKHTET